MPAVVDVGTMEVATHCERRMTAMIEIVQHDLSSLNRQACPTAFGNLVHKSSPCSLSRREALTKMPR
jgi:hypothetical protein